jgi:hypothetical protein
VKCAFGLVLSALFHGLSPFSDLERYLKDQAAVLARTTVLLLPPQHDTRRLRKLSVHS